MVRELVRQLFEGDKYYIEAAGLSTDTKPTVKIITGSTFMEVDTGDVYTYDEVGETWHKVGGTADANGGD